VTRIPAPPGDGQRFPVLFEHTSDIALVVDADGAVRDLNPAAERLLGFKRNDVVGHSLLEFIAPEHRADVAAIPQRMGPGAELETEVELVSRSGDRIVLDARTVPVTRPGRATEYHWIARDRTRRKLAEERVRAAQDVSNDFVAAVSHQLRAPLTVIKWSLELAANTPGIGPEVKELIAGSQSAAEELIRVSTDLLNYARIDEGDTPFTYEQVDLGALTWKVLRDLRWFASAQRHQITVGTAGQDASALSDPIPLSQVMQTLLGNAIRYTPPGGQINVGIMGERDSVVWSISDTGPGIPAGLLERVFDQFADVTGSGVGLYIVRRLVERLGGSAWVESAPGEGSTFAVRIPRSPSQVAPSTDAEAA